MSKLLRSRGRRIGLRAVVGLASATLVLAAACEQASLRETSGSDELRRSITVPGLRRHLEALQAIADDRGGNRAAGQEGFDASAEYVRRVLAAAGYRVQVQEFQIPSFEQRAPTTLSVAGDEFLDGRDVRAMLFSASGAVNAPVSIVGPDAGGGGSGCQAEDFEGFPAGSVAVIRPGPCFRRDQVTNAQEAGAAAIVVSYPGMVPGSVRRSTLISPDGISIPAVAATEAVGQALDRAAFAGTLVQLSVHAEVVERPTRNVIAETAEGSEEGIVMLGAHLDSVLDGPGLNDNGTGVAGLLEIARQLARARPELDHRIRFAFWSGEELGLYGSRHYVESLNPAERDAIAVYLNFDMLGSLNYARYVYQDEGPPGTEVVRRAFEDYFGRAGLAYDTVDLAGRSDHGPFADAGIPIGGLFSGAEGVATRDQAGLFDGIAGVAHDECYHLPCDHLGNVHNLVLEEMVDAAAHVAFTLADRPGDPLAA